MENFNHQPADSIRSWLDEMQLPEDVDYYNYEPSSYLDSLFDLTETSNNTIFDLPMPPLPALPDLIEDNAEQIIVKNPSTMQEIATLQAQQLHTHHQTARRLDEGLHHLMSVLSLALRHVSTERCISDCLQILADACVRLKADGEALLLIDKGGYGIMCKTFQSVAYRMELVDMLGEMTMNDWVDTLAGMRERIVRMRRNELHRSAMVMGMAMMQGPKWVRGSDGRLRSS